MRLIDADELIENVVFHKDNVGTNNEMYKIAHKHIIDLINIQPTAYDIDNVVEELEKMTRGVGTTINDNCVIGVRRGYENASRKAIEIVKAGVKNDAM